MCVCVCVCMCACVYHFSHLQKHDYYNIPL